MLRFDSSSGLVTISPSGEMTPRKDEGNDQSSYGAASGTFCRPFFLERALPASGSSDERCLRRREREGGSIPPGGIIGMNDVVR